MSDILIISNLKERYKYKGKDIPNSMISSNTGISPMAINIYEYRFSILDYSNCPSMLLFNHKDGYVDTLEKWYMEQYKVFCSLGGKALLSPNLISGDIYGQYLMICEKRLFKNFISFQRREIECSRESISKSCLNHMRRYENMFYRTTGRKGYSFFHNLYGEQPIVTFDYANDILFYYWQFFTDKGISIMMGFLKSNLAQLVKII